MQATETSPFPAGPLAGIRAVNPETEMTVDLIISDDAEICIIHDRPFSTELSWLEYNITSSEINFILEDGQLRNFGIPVRKEHRAYFHNAHIVNVIFWNSVIKKYESGFEFPLIVHAA